MSTEKQDDRRNVERPSDQYHRSEDTRESYHPRGGYGRSRGPAHEGTTYRGRFPRARGGQWVERGGRGRGGYAGRGEGRGEGRGRAYFRAEQGRFNYRGRGGEEGVHRSGRGKHVYKDDYEHNSRREYREPQYPAHERYDDDHHYKERRRYPADDTHYRDRRSHSRERDRSADRGRHERSSSRERSYSRECSKYSQEGSSTRNISSREGGRVNSIEREYRKILRRDRSRSRSLSKGRSPSGDRRNLGGSRDRSSSQSITSRSEGSRYSRSWERSKSRDREHAKGRRRSRSGSFSRSPSDWRVLPHDSRGAYSVNLEQDDGLYGTDQETSEIIKDTFSEVDQGKSKKRHTTYRRSESSESSSEEDRRFKQGSLRTSSNAKSNNATESMKKTLNTFSTKKTEGMSDLFRDKGRLDELAKDISIKISNPEAKLETRYHQSQKVTRESSLKSSRKSRDKGSKTDKLTIFGALNDLFHNTKASKGGEFDSKDNHQETSRDSFQQERMSAIPGLDSVHDVDDEEEFLYGDLPPIKPEVHAKPPKQKTAVLRGSSEMDWETHEPPPQTSNLNRPRREDAHSGARKYTETKANEAVHHHEPVFPPVTSQPPPSHHNLTQTYQPVLGLEQQHLLQQAVQHISTAGQMVTAPSIPHGTLSAVPVAAGHQQQQQPPVSAGSYQPSLSSAKAEAKNFEAIQQANLLSAIHQPGFMDAVNRGRRGDRITESDLLAAAHYQEPSPAMPPALPPVQEPVQQCSAPQSSISRTQLQIKELLSSERRIEPEKPPKPEPSKDKTIENILQSIGFNFELSKIMQEKADKEKEREAGMKESVDSFGIKEGSSFLQGGLKNVDIQSVFDNKEGSKPKKSSIIPEESYEERARRYMEEEKRSMAATGAVGHTTQYEQQKTYQASDATHSLDYLRMTYEEKQEPGSYEHYDYHSYNYGDKYDYENRQFLEMQQQQVSNNVAEVGIATTEPNTVTPEVSQPNLYSYFSTAVPGSVHGASVHQGQSKEYARQSPIDSSHPRKETEKPTYGEQESLDSYPGADTREVRTARRRRSSESHEYHPPAKVNYPREHNLEKIERKEALTMEGSDQRDSGVTSMTRVSPLLEQRERYSTEKASPDHRQGHDGREFKRRARKEEKSEKKLASDVMAMQGRYRIVEKAARETRDLSEYSPERKPKKPRFHADLSPSEEILERKLLEVNVQADSAAEEVPHQRKVTMTKGSDNTDDLITSSREHRRTVVAHSTERVVPKERLTKEQQGKLKKEMQERRKKLGHLEKELEFLAQEQQDLRQRSQRDGHRDNMMDENSKLQAEIGKQITYLRRAVEDNMKRLNSVEPPSSPERREATPKRKIKEEESSNSQTRNSGERSRVREKSPELEETRKIFVEKKRKLDSYPETMAGPAKREMSSSLRRDGSPNRKPTKEFEKAGSREQFKRTNPNPKWALRPQSMETKPKVEDKYVNKRFQLYFEYFDGGRHWCSSCRHTSEDMDACFDHIQSKKHIKRSENYAKPWARLPERKLPPHVKAVKVPIKGVEFLSSCQAFYCSLCNLFSGEQAIALEHLKSDDHNEKYKVYCDEHPGYEKKLNLDKNAGQSIRKKLKSKKKSKKSRKKKTSKKQSPEKEVNPKKINFKVGKARALPASKVEESRPGSSSSSSSSTSNSSSSSSSSSDSSSDTEKGGTGGFKKIVPPKKPSSEKPVSSNQQKEAGDAKKQPFKFPLIGRTAVIKGGKINVKMATGNEKKYMPKEEVPAPKPKLPPVEPEIILRKKPSKWSEAKVMPDRDQKKKSGRADEDRLGEAERKTLDLFLKMETTAGSSVALPVVKDTIPPPATVPMPITVPIPLTTAPIPLTTAPILLTMAPIPLTTAAIPLTTAPIPLTVPMPLTAPMPLATIPMPLASIPIPLTTVPEKKAACISPPVITQSAIANAFAPSVSKKPIVTPEERQQAEEMKMLGLDPSDSTLSHLPSAPPPVVLPRNENPKERKSFMASSNAAKLYNIFYGGLEKKEYKLPKAKAPSTISVTNIPSVKNIPMPPMKHWQKPTPKVTQPIQTLESSSQKASVTTANIALVATPANTALLATPSANIALLATPSTKPALLPTPSAKPVLLATPSAKPALLATPSAKPALLVTPSANTVLWMTPGPEVSIDSVLASSNNSLSNVTENVEKKDISQKAGVNTVDWENAGNIPALTRAPEVKSQDVGNSVLETTALNVTMASNTENVSAEVTTSFIGKWRSLIHEPCDITSAVSSSEENSNSIGIINCPPQSILNDVKKKTKNNEYSGQLQSVCSSERSGQLQLVGTSESIGQLQSIGSNESISLLPSVGLSLSSSQLQSVGTSESIGQLQTVGTSESTSQLQLVGTSESIGQLQSVGTSESIGPLQSVHSSDSICQLQCVGSSDSHSKLHSVASSGEGLIKSDIEVKDNDEVSSKDCVQIGTNESSTGVAVSDIVLPEIPEIVLTPYQLPNVANVASSVEMTETITSPEINAGGTSNTDSKQTNENESNMADNEVSESRSISSNIHEQSIQLETAHVFSTTETIHREFDPLRASEASTLNVDRPEMREEDTEPVGRESGMCRKAENDQNKSSVEFNENSKLIADTWSSKGSDSSDIVGSQTISQVQSLNQVCLPPVSSLTADDTQVGDTASLETVSQVGPPTLEGDKEEISFNPDSTTDTVAKFTPPPADEDDALDFLEITPSPVESAGKTPRRGSRRGRPRGQRGRGRGGRGKYRSRKVSESTPSDESMEESTRKMEEKVEDVGVVPDSRVQSGQSSDLSSVQQEEAGADQMGGKWKALQTVAVTSSQAVTLEDIARQSGTETHPEEEPTENETLAMSGFELLDECSEH